MAFESTKTQPQPEEKRTESTMHIQMPPTYLPPSELGTKDYWESFYERSLAHISTKRNANADADADADASHKPEHINDNNNDNEEEKEEEENISDDDDPGTSWFSEHKAPEKVLRFLTSREFPFSPVNVSNNNNNRQNEQQQQQPTILDLGAGNGSMLALLRKRGGFTESRMVGVDYSGRSVELARELQRVRGHSAYFSDDDDNDDDDDDDGESESKSLGELDGGLGRLGLGNGGGDRDIPPSFTSTVTEPNTKANDPISTNPIRFEEWDILSPFSERALSTTTTTTSSSSQGGKGKENEFRLNWFPYENGGFDIVLDKGTFDAVSLSDEVQEQEQTTETKTVQRRVCERYPVIARKLVRKGGFLVVTSCNWTEEELIRWFTCCGGGDVHADRLTVWGRVEYPRFRFGGMEGQGVCTVCFQRV